MRRGQALVEFALVFPILCFLLLAVIEAGALMAEWTRWQHLAGEMADGSAGDLPSWWTAEAAAADCTDAAAVYVPGSPARVRLSCRHTAMAVNGFAPVVTVEAVAAPPAVVYVTPSPEPTCVMPQVVNVSPLDYRTIRNGIDMILAAGFAAEPSLSPGWRYEDLVWRQYPAPGAVVPCTSSTSLNV